MLRNENASSRSRNTALEEIGKLSFAIDDLRLYLDTHPNCTEALEMIKEYLGKRKILMDNFTEKFGALDAYGLVCGDSWVWNEGYMPWEAYEGGC
ncbi:MAG: spore coat protein CotJB [Clostridia bacterium]|nr:spore coat protein CotJB [Clostridia bacterium]